jgi:hypothetical protein
MLSEGIQSSLGWTTRTCLCQDGTLLLHSLSSGSFVSRVDDEAHATAILWTSTAYMVYLILDADSQAKSLAVRSMQGNLVSRVDARSLQWVDTFSTLSAAADGAPSVAAFIGVHLSVGAIVCEPILSAVLIRCTAFVCRISRAERFYRGAFSY